MAIAFELKKIYNFNMKSEVTPLLGEKFTNMKVLSIMTSDQALKERDIATLHEQVKPFLENVSVNISDLNYILFETIDKEKVIYPIEYIDMTSLTVVESIDIRVDLSKCSTTDLEMIKTILNESGYTNYDINVINK